MGVVTLIKPSLIWGFFYSITSTKPSQMLKFYKNKLISFENVCVIKI